MKLWQAIKLAYYNSFNLNLAIISACFKGLVVESIVNRSFGWHEIISASIAQAIVNFIITGFAARLVQHFSLIKNSLHSYFLGSTIPVAAIFIMSYIAHWLNGTENFWSSILWPTGIGFIGSIITNYLTRNRVFIWFLPKNYPA